MWPAEPAQDMPLPGALADEFDEGKPYVQQMLQIFAGQSVGEAHTKDGQQ